MTERTVTGAPEPLVEVEPAPPLVTDATLLVLLVGNGLLLGAFGLVFTPLYTNGIPVPMGIVLSVLVLPWLVQRAGEIDPRPAVASAPLVAWLVAVVALGLFGPGGDAMLMATWQSLLLVVAGVLAGLWGLRTVLMMSSDGSARG